MKALTGDTPRDPQGGGTFVAHHMVFNKHYVCEMLEFMRKFTRSTLPWPLLIMSQSRRFYRFSEYKTYATFMLNRHPADFHYYPLSDFGEGGLRFRDANRIVEQMLAECPLSKGGMSYAQIVDFAERNLEEFKAPSSTVATNTTIPPEQVVCTTPGYIQLDHVYGISKLGLDPEALPVFTSAVCDESFVVVNTTASATVYVPSNINENSESIPVKDLDNIHALLPPAGILPTVVEVPFDIENETTARTFTTAASLATTASTINTMPPSSDAMPSPRTGLSLALSDLILAASSTSSSISSERAAVDEKNGALKVGKKEFDFKLGGVVLNSKSNNNNNSKQTTVTMSALTCALRPLAITTKSNNNNYITTNNSSNYGNSFSSPLMPSGEFKRTRIPNAASTRSNTAPGKSPKTKMRNNSNNNNTNNNNNNNSGSGASTPPRSPTTKATVSALLAAEKKVSPPVTAATAKRSFYTSAGVFASMPTCALTATATSTATLKGTRVVGNAGLTGQAVGNETCDQSSAHYSSSNAH